MDEPESFEANRKMDLSPTEPGSAEITTSISPLRSTDESISIPVSAMKGKTYWLWLAASMPFFCVCAIWTLFCIICLFSLFTSLGWGLFYLIIFAILFKVTYSIGMFFYRRRLSRNRHIVQLSKERILFPTIYGYSLLDRLERNWPDVHAVDFSAAVTPRMVRDWSDLKGRFITLDFKSGGSVALDLEFIEKPHVEQLLEAIDLWCVANVFSERAALLHRYLVCIDDQIPLSLTSIWTESMHLHFATTNFAPLKSATVLNNAYRLRMQLACNGFSAVYLADNNHQQKVIIKESVLPVDMQDEVKVKARELFEREAALLSKVDHSNIVKVLDFFVEQQREYIVLQYVPGMNLRQLRQGGSTIPEETLRTYARQILEILDYLHSLSPPILHRDLTPDNLIVDASGKITLIDFGASNEYVGQATGTLIGKQSYIPPEQFKGKAIPASDVFAFGATMFFLVTGDDPVPLSESVCSSSSSLINGMIEDCTQLDAEKRPSVRVLLDRILKTY